MKKPFNTSLSSLISYTLSLLIGIMIISCNNSSLDKAGAGSGAGEVVAGETIPGSPETDPEQAAPRVKITRIKRPYFDPEKHHAHVVIELSNHGDQEILLSNVHFKLGKLKMQASESESELPDKMDFKVNRTNPQITSLGKGQSIRYQIESTEPVLAKNESGTLSAIIKVSYTYKPENTETEIDLGECEVKWKKKA